MHPAFIVAATVFLGASLHAASEPPVGEPIEVFVGGQGGYPVYRIPAATRLEHASHAGRLLAFAEGRP
ncbi:MAG: hypothetical protein ACO3QC_07540, partial [Phycisphaerales bacterium]